MESRNKICINFFNKGEFVTNYTDTICDPILIEIVNKIIGIIISQRFDKDIFNYVIIQKTINTSQIAVKIIFKNCINCIIPGEYVMIINQHLKIQVLCYQYTSTNASPTAETMVYYVTQKKLIDIYDRMPWSFNMDSFTQNCFAEEIHKTVNRRLIAADTYYGLGGESGYYFMANLYKYKQNFVYNDSHFICQDCIDAGINCQLVDFSRFIFTASGDAILVVNISKHGLKKLASQINKLLFKQIIYISCDKQSFEADMNVMKNYYVNNTFSFNDIRFVFELGPRV